MTGLSQFADGIATAHEKYLSHRVAGVEAQVVMIVQVMYHTLIVGDVRNVSALRLPFYAADREKHR